MSLLLFCPVVELELLHQRAGCKERRSNKSVSSVGFCKIGLRVVKNY